MTRLATPDVVIVGGGMVGASLACALCRAGVPGWRIMIVEATPVMPEGQVFQPGFDTRSTVLSHVTAEYFRSLGLWHALEQRAAPVRRIHVSDQGRFGAVRLDSEDLGVPALGYVVENGVLGIALNRAMLSLEGIEVHGNTRVTAIEPGATGYRLKLVRAGEAMELDTPLVVLAEGGRSGLAQKLGIDNELTPYGQSAVVTNIAFDRDLSGVAYERFTPNGPLAVLPLPPIAEVRHRAALVWTQPEQDAEPLAALPAEQFLARLQREFGYRCGRLIRVGQRVCYPLSLVRAREQIRPGLVLLGNAAHFLHPVAGQGFNLSLREAMMLAEVLSNARRQGRDLGDHGLLMDYARGCEADQDSTIAFSHYMTKLFSSSSESLAWLRKFGMLGIDLLPPLKQTFSSRAMGLAARRAFSE